MILIYLKKLLFGLMVAFICIVNTVIHTFPVEAWYVGFLAGKGGAPNSQPAHRQTWQQDRRIEKDLKQKQTICHVE